MSHLLHNHARFVHIMLCSLLLLGNNGLYGQTANPLDSLYLRKVHISRSKFINNIFQQAVNSVSRNPGDNMYLGG
jgi:hypothetical protein